MKLLRVVCLAMLVPAIAGAQKRHPAKTPMLGIAPVKDVVAAMTTEEKVKLLVGMGFNIEGIPAGMLPPVAPEDRIPEKVPGAAGRTHAIPRLGIPTITVSDGPAGVRINPIRKKDSTKTYYATAFPVGTLLASTWDTALVRHVGMAFGHEVKEYGIDVLLGPGMNIQRNPLGGRNFEYFSEDPIVSGNMAASIVRGIQSNGVGTSIKHFVANNAEFNRTSLNTHVNERALREIYLKGFEIAVKKSQPWTVMSSYNLVNDTYTSQSYDLLTTILRNEWGFKGFVMSDWFGGKDAVAQVNAGNDLMMPGTALQTKTILDGVKSGAITQKQLDADVTHMLNVILKTPSFKKYNYSDKPHLAADAMVSRTAAADGMVLLKNDGNVLPLAGRKVSLFGNNGYNLITGGSGSGMVNKAYVISLDKGLNNAGYTADVALAGSYRQYLADAKAKMPKPTMMSMFMAPPPIAEMPLNDGILKNEAASNDAAIISIGKIAGEGQDRKAEDFNISAAEAKMIDDVSTAYHAAGKKVVVVLNTGGVLEVATWRDKVDGILLAWQPGLEGGNAIADVLSGKVNPSGKLAVTFPVNYNDVYNAKDFPGKVKTGTTAPANPMLGSQPSDVTYDDGVFVGYRYFNTFNVKPAYEFGFGKSYTDFSYSKFKLSSDKFKNGHITATILVTNKGKAAGKEVVQLYISAPSKTMQKPESELKGFAKTRLLKPGEAQVLTFIITADDLASFSTATESWIAEAGKYQVRIGASSLDTKKSGDFTVANPITTSRVHKALAPNTTINELVRAQ